MHHVSSLVRTRVCLIRHGETDWNVEKRIQGHTDVPLNETGRAQALAMAFNAAHQRFDAIYSSDLARAVETAQALAQREGQAVRLLPTLRERHFGLFQGLTAAEAASRHPAAHAHYVARDLDYDFGTGESLRRFAARVGEAIDWLLRHHAGQTVAAVSHSGVLDIVYRRATGRPLSAPRDFKIPNCALNWFHFDSQGWHLEAWGDRHHLHEVLMEPPE
ncbi:histidine phosphatase family protein [Thiobacillus sedimenti]|uniref:Histidine phosphatase family protein n=1 Tax=Thiobacillus sedimenti TaxID=3110231 RepID=A0ABZ1CKP2_9PROT|nr:histidine phosphatase family protein [Thiobacillus sp. SCUT-2]WRS39959.1 histidine phosphatase family protein [Thiobacillus sp. SCUT-2]